MQGGLFGLTKIQKVYLYGSQLIPTLIVLLSADLIISMVLLQIFYVSVSYIYIKWMSFQNSFYPYTSNQLGKLKWQIEKGMVLGFSAFLLISIYGIIFIKIGRVVLPHSVNLGWTFHSYWYIFILLCAINPILQEWYWRLFLPKTFQSAYYKLHVINVAYLLFHFVLFSYYVGFWRALPLVFTFFSIGRSMSHIKMKYGIMSSIVTHYGISFGGLVMYLYLRGFTDTQFIYQ